MKEEFIEKAIAWLRENVKITDAEGNTLIGINEDAFRNALMDTSEEKDVDLEEEIDKYFQPIQAWEVQEAPFSSLDKCARHFAEWGAEHLKR